MADKIKQENLVDAGYDTETGDKFVNEIEEYICSACHHLVQRDDRFCWQCGEELNGSSIVLHYYRGEKLTNVKFKEAKTQLGGVVNES